MLTAFAYYERTTLAAAYLHGGAAYDEATPFEGEGRKQKASSLGGGERQMLAIASAQMMKPSLLILHEPTTGLAPQLVHDTTERTVSMNKAGTTILWVGEENPMDVMSVADSVYLLQGATVTQSRARHALRSESRQHVSRLVEGGSMLLEPGRIAGLRIPNRVLRSATCEAMGTDRGEVTPHLIELHRQLTRGHVGATVLGHAYVHPRGQASRHQTGIYDDSLIPGLAALVQAVHREGGLVFAQIAHAGGQSHISAITKLAPSPIPNALLGVMPREASEAEIQEAIAAFGAAAGRAVKAGFDAVEIHAANGYLISEFSSPYANRRGDAWGGDASRRSAFINAVYDAVRAAVGPEYPVLLKLGMVDMVDGGLGLDESLERLASLQARGLDGVQISCGVMSSGDDSCHTYVAVDGKQAVRDILPWRLAAPAAPEAYWVPWAQAARSRVPGLPIMLVGGMRSVQVMERVLSSGAADFVCIGRPLVREPDFVLQAERCRKDTLDCTSCNLCLIHDGYNELQCWRTPRHRLLEHAYMEFTGKLRAQH